MYKKHQVFISSTYVDLKEERQKICDAVLTLYQIPIGMEMFSAADEEQWEIIKSHIDDTDFYVLIIGNRYGSVIKDGPDAGISYTEKEYNYAVANGVPVLAFLIDEEVPVKPSFVEKKYQDELAAFKEKVCQGREVVWWKSTDDLVAKVSQSLAKQILRNKRPGWIRANSSVVEKNVTSIQNINFHSAETRHLISEVNVNEIDTIKAVEEKNKKDLVAVDKEAELYRIYLEDICPMIVRLEVVGGEFPFEVVNEIRAAFTHIARYKVQGEDQELINARRHISRCQLDVRKYDCILEEEYFQAFMSNQKRVGWKKKLIPDDIVRVEVHAKELFMYAKQAEANSGKTFDEILNLYDEATNIYDEVRTMIDNYIKAL